jgi:iron complex outermembrane receptor protein
MRAILAFLFFLALPTPAVLAQVSGTVVDGSDAPVAGAALQLFVPGSGQPRAVAVSDEQGRFLMERVQPGRYDLHVSHVAFAARVLPVEVGADGATLTVHLSDAVISHRELVVSAGRARQGLSPVTVSNVTAVELARQPDMKDLPVHLARQPSITYHSENGNAIGYSTLRMRGFDQRRLAVAINGIPQNDPEEFNVFWINFFDIQGAVQDIQIQRGAGSSVYGPTAIGGAINLRAMPYRPDFRANLHVGGGAFGTRRYTADVNTGLLGGRWVAFGRLSRLESDGYRDWSWSEFWRFFAGVTRYGERHTVTLQAYGGPQRDGLAYSGIPKAANKATIDDGFGGTIDREYNYSAFDRDVEDFHQPHVEVHHAWHIREGLSFSQALFWVKGVGYFDFGGSFRSATYLRLPAGIVAAGEEDLPLFVSRPDIRVLFRAYLDQWQVGWMPRLQWQDNVSCIEACAGDGSRIPTCSLQTWWARKPMPGSTSSAVRRPLLRCTRATCDASTIGGPCKPTSRPRGANTVSTRRRFSAMPSASPIRSSTRASV